MTVIQQQRLIGATLVVLLVAVLAWLVLASVDTQDNTKSANSEDPIVFESVVEPINEDTTTVREDANERASKADESIELSEQSEAKVVIPAQTVESQSAAEETSTSTDTATPLNNEKSRDTDASDERSAQAEQLEPVITQPQSETAPDSETPSQPETTSQQETSPQSEATSQQETSPQPETASQTEPASQPESIDKEPAETEVTSQDDASDDKTQWVVQLASFSKPENAESLKDQLQESGYDARIEKAEVDGSTIYRVRLPAGDDRTRLEEIAAELTESMGLAPQIQTHTP